MAEEKDRGILRELARRYAELAALPVNEERNARIRRINGLVPDRPVVWINEIPWHEMDIDGQLILRCEGPEARKMEWFFREKLFRWKYFQADMVLEPAYFVQKHSHSTSIGVTKDDDILSTDAENNIVSHSYKDVLKTEEDLEKLTLPLITADREADEKEMNFAIEVLAGILPAKLRGGGIYWAPWDQISQLRGVEPILLDTVLRPEFLRKTIARFTEIGLSQMEQMEALGLYDWNVDSLHCTPPWTDDLPAPDYTTGPARLKDIWFRGMAQMFNSVSPEMHEMLDVEYMRPLAERCGLTYYGCCEPLHDRLDMLKKISNLRKVGVSPWADVRRSAEELGKSYVYARKPNPAFVAGVVDAPTVRAEIKETVEVCLENGCPYEFVLKDISTVSRKPGNLIEWNRIVQETIDEYY